MPIFRTSLQHPLSRRLMPLVYGLAVVIGFILAFTWAALQMQSALAGLLNGESVWSKAQKQMVIDLDAYAARGDAGDLARFKSNYAVLEVDRWARESVSNKHFNQREVTRALDRNHTIQASIPGVIFILRNFRWAPYVRGALAAWRSSDAAVAQLAAIGSELKADYADGSMVPEQITRQRSRIAALNDFIEPRSKLFSVEIAHGATWLGHALFIAVASAASLALLLWLGMARRVLASIRGTEERYRLVFDSAADAIVMVDEASGRILEVNRKAVQWTGCDENELVGKPFDALFVHSHPHGERVAIGALRNADGSTRPVESQSSLVQWGELSVRQAIIRDISERVSMEQERRIASEALANVAEGVIIADANRRVIQINAAHTAINGFKLYDLQAHCFDETRCLPDGEPLPSSVWETIAAGGNWLGEVQSLRRDGTSYPELLSISAIRDLNECVQHYVAVFTNISTAKANQRRLEHMATHDPLTGLVNRAEFERRCAKVIDVATRERTAAAVLFIDLDAFKAVNDSYSHAIGDRLLAHVAERITAELGEHDLAGRIGGDEFTVLINRLASREQAAALANRLLAKLAEPVVVGDYEIVLSASIGIAGYPLDGADPAALITNADSAMYAAKTQERNTFRFYSPMMQADARKRLVLAAELRQALARGELRLVYQPSLEMRTGRVIAVEALLRWRHPERGEVSPGDFIPMAESLGLMRHIDEWVLQAATRQMAEWDLAGMPPIRVAVNISASSYGLAGFVDDVRRTLEARHLSPTRLMLEITESAMLQLGDEMERTLRALHALGVGVAIDDFGTGYSSMAYLKLPAIAFLKIDQSFVAGLPDNANDVAIVEAMLALSKNLGLQAIAEGIETEAQHDFLVRAGCSEGQGFLYSRGVEARELERMLRRNPNHGAARLRLVPPQRG